MKKYGRAFNHLEDLTFFYGSSGVQEAILHIIEVCSGNKKLRMKWDGSCQVYWGRETENGPLIMAGHNGWARQIKATSSEEVYDFIANNSGVKSEERNNFATKFSKLYPLLDSITPANKNFYYADALFIEQPVLINNKYTMCPNGKTTYIVEEQSLLGQQINNGLHALLVGHGTFTEFGLADEYQIPVSCFESFVSNEILVLQPYYNSCVPELLQSTINCLQHTLNINYDLLNNFLEPIHGVSLYKDYFYRYVNYKSKSKQLSTLGTDFVEWLENSNVSNNQKTKIKQRIAEYPTAIQVMFDMINMILELKNNIIHTVDDYVIPYQMHILQHEGWVRYADNTKQFGNVKFVPRHLWLP